MGNALGILLAKRTMLYLVLVGSMCAVGMGNVHAAQTVVVTLSNELKFEPNHVTVHVGQTIEWNNASVLVHTVTDVPKLASNAKDVALPPQAASFDSGNLAPGATFRHRFLVPGTYRYFCIPHEAAGMIGEVTVVK